MDKYAFGKYLNQLRGKRSTRQVEILTGVSKSYLSLLERGLRDIPSPDVLKKLSHAYKVDYMELMDKAGYLGSTDIRAKLVMLRGSRSFEEYTQFLQNSGCTSVAPDLIEMYENGTRVPTNTYLDYVMKAEGLSPDYFGVVKEDENSPPDVLSFMDKKLADWVTSADNLKYIEFAYRVCEMGISADSIDNVGITINPSRIKKAID